MLAILAVIWFAILLNNQQYFLIKMINDPFPPFRQESQRVTKGYPALHAKGLLLVDDSLSKILVLIKNPKSVLNVLLVISVLSSRYS